MAKFIRVLLNMFRRGKRGYAVLRGGLIVFWIIYTAKAVSEN